MTRRGRLEYAPPTSHPWTVIAHGRVVSILPATTPPVLVARLWSAATTASVSLESYVASIPLFGPDAVDSFAVALIEDVKPGADRPEARIEVVLRGSGIVRLDSPSGTRTIDARGSEPWYLAEYDDVTSFILAAMPLADADVQARGENTLPLLSGVVPAGWARWTPKPPVPSETDEFDDTVLGLGTGRREAPAATPVETEPSDAVGRRLAEDGDALTGDTVLGARDGSPARLDPVHADPVDGETILSARRPSAAGAAHAASEGDLDDTILPAGGCPASPPAADLDDTILPAGGCPASPPAADLDDTVLTAGGRPASPAADHDDTVLTAGGRPASPHAADLDDTVLTAGGRPASPAAADFDDTILTAGRRPAPSPGPAATARPDDGAERPSRTPLYAFRVGVGETYPLERPAYLGRRPSAPRIVTGVTPRLVRVGSPLQEVSSTHLEIRQEGTTVVVTDLRSTNGTVISAPGADRLTLRQGQSVVVAPGTRIDIGDGNVVEILPAR